MIRPTWTVRTDEERTELARLDVAVEAFRATEQRMWEVAKRLRDLRVPPDVIAEKIGTSRSSVYRETDRRFGVTEATANE